MHLKDNIRVELIHYSQYHIHMVAKKGNEHPWRLTCIYGKANVSERGITWDLLRFLRSESGLPWVNTGEFNEVLSQAEHMVV